MEEQGRLRVTLELDRRTDDPISGRIGVGDDVREFSGWLRLIAVLEDARRVRDGARSPPLATGRDARRGVDDGMQPPNFRP